MRNRSDINALFRNGLKEAEMPVRDGFWESLQEELSASDVRRHTVLLPHFHQIAAAASVLLFLGAASAAFWYFSPREEMQQAFTQAEIASSGGHLAADVTQPALPPVPTRQAAAKSHRKQLPATLIEEATDDEGTVQVHLSITIREHYVPAYPRSYGEARTSSYGRPAHCAEDVTASVDEDGVDEDGVDEVRPRKAKWAIKAGVGTSLPKEGFDAPLTASLTAERRIGKRFAVETGLQYNRLGSEERTLHTLAIPVRLQGILATSDKFELYATGGVTAEKCLAGATDNSFSAEPVRMAVNAGVGVRYKLSDQLALFAEPTVSHHFDTESNTRSLRTERPTNFNLLCGLRMAY